MDVHKKVALLKGALAEMVHYAPDWVDGLDDSAAAKFELACSGLEAVLQAAEKEAIEPPEKA